MEQAALDWAAVSVVRFKNPLKGKDNGKENQGGVTSQ
jgi:hypothetical protein